MRRAVLCLCLVACQREPQSTGVASASASAPAPAVTVPGRDTRSAWWGVASKSKVFTEERRIDAENRLKMLPEDQRRRTVAVLDRIAAQPATGAGFHDAGELARGAQDEIRDPKSSGSDHSPVFRTIAETSLIVLHRLVAKACAEAGDAASLKTLAAAIRQAPLPRIPAPGIGQLSDGRHERNQIEQEMQMALDAKAFQAAFAGAPPAAKNAP